MDKVMSNLEGYFELFFLMEEVGNLSTDFELTLG